jgi:uncharacterized protein (DUF1778 family)
MVRSLSSPKKATRIKRATKALATSIAKRGRLEVRVDASLKALIKRAALLQGRSVTDFVLAAVQEAAARVVREAMPIALSEEASRRFAATLLAPPMPNTSMRAANVLRRALFNT